jgi:hypothetical protein
MTGITCNYAAICVDPDCKFEHPISIKDRKVVRRLYDGIGHVNKSEVDSHKRRANCKFGQICFNSSCGYRHRLCFADRMKLVDGFNDMKLDMTKNAKVPVKSSPKVFVIDARNSFDCLDDVSASYDVSGAKSSSWEDLCEDDMTFDDFPALSTVAK